jgi:hypothetical protein
LITPRTWKVENPKCNISSAVLNALIFSTWVGVGFLEGAKSVSTNDYLSVNTL